MSSTTLNDKHLQQATIFQIEIPSLIFLKKVKNTQQNFSKIFNKFWQRKTCLQRAKDARQ
jgi:hypothetical protein